MNVVYSHPLHTLLIKLFNISNTNRSNVLNKILFNKIRLFFFYPDANNQYGFAGAETQVFAQQIYIWCSVLILIQLHCCLWACNILSCILSHCLYGHRWELCPQTVWALLSLYNMNIKIYFHREGRKVKYV